MKCVRVLRKDAEKARKTLLASQNISLDYKALAGRKYVYFPVKGFVPGFLHEEKSLHKWIKVHPITVGAYDLIGDIAIFPENVKPSLGKQLLNSSNVHVILRQKGIHAGEYRTRNVVWVAGEKRTETVHKENGVVMKLDVRDCYFSPRLATERLRIAKQVKPGEKVLVLFSGVGPYLLTIARHSRASLIVGVEKNAIAHRYAQYNCRKFPQVRLFHKDVRQFSVPEKFDRVLMPLPKSAEDFLDVAYKLVKKKGVIHFYDFVPEADMKKTLKKIRKKIKKFSVLSFVRCGQYAPGRFRVCADIRVV